MDGCFVFRLVCVELGAERLEGCGGCTSDGGG